MTGAPTGPESGWTPSSIPGVLTRNLTAIADARGAFMEIWRASWSTPLAATFRQANLSRSEPNVLRGMHFHERQSDLWIVLEGRSSVALADLRPAIRDPRTPTSSEHLEMKAGSALFIPEGVAHGFLALDRLELLYLVTNEYDGSDEHGFAWDDPSAGITWPIEAPIVSDRDRSNPPLATAVASARQRGTFVPAR
jgi:dTDP-4-dehydrorhamnose 3,5-epimerase